MIRVSPDIRFLQNASHRLPYYYSTFVFVPKNGHSFLEIWIASQSFRFMMPKKISKHSHSYFCQRLMELLVPDLAEATDGCNAQEPKIVVCRFVIGSSLLVQERHEAEGVLSKPA